MPSLRDLGRSDRKALFRRGERDVGVGGGHQVVDIVLAFAVSAALVEPTLQMFASSGSKFGEEKSGAALVAGPDYIGVSLQSYVGAGEHAAKSQV